MNTIKVIKTKTYCDKEDAKRFKIWLIQNDMVLKQFSNKCGYSISYISEVINGHKPIRDDIVAAFKKGGYDLV